MSFEFDAKTISDYIAENGTSYLNDDLYIMERIQGANNELKCPSGAKGSTASQRELGQFLYMDVGRWGGDGPGLNDSSTTWARQRNFGLVCGSFAVLCSYEKPNTSAIAPEGLNDPASIEQNLKDTIEFKTINWLLAKLSSKSSLGPVRIKKALRCTFPSVSHPSIGEILVFLGDLHVPVMDLQERTYLQDQNVDKTWARPRGRIDIKAVKDFLTCSGTALFLPAINRPAPRIIPPNIITGFLDCVNKLATTQQLTTWDDNERISGSDAETWFDYYHGKGGKGADLFQNAGSDLKDFLELLLEYQKSSKEDTTSQKKPVRLYQLGDLFDFWIGLKRAFDKIRPPIMYDPTAAKKFIDFWRNESLEKSQQGAAIKMLLNGTVDLNPIFIYGNHDSYRATSLWSSNPLGDPNHISEKGYWAEHGHQIDGFNQDESAWKGWAMTQAAYFIPAIRTLEGPARAIIDKYTPKDPGTRLKYVKRAAGICHVPDRKTVFVMGHTHVPMLKLVHILQC